MKNFITWENKDRILAQILQKTAINEKKYRRNEEDGKSAPEEIDRGSKQSEWMQKAFIQAERLYQGITFGSKVPYFHVRLRTAYLLSEEMNGLTEEIICALLAPVFAGMKPPTPGVETVSGESLRQYYGKETCLLIQAAARQTERMSPRPKERDAMLDEYLFGLACERCFREVKRKMRGNNLIIEPSVEEAYRIASDKYRGHRRLSGDPVLFHALYVADRMADLGADSDAVAAALLHDVLPFLTDREREDLDVSVSPAAARYLRAVAELDRRFAQTLVKEEQESILSLPQTDPDDAIIALYIQAASRLHNLITAKYLSGTEYFRMADHTETHYLPLLQKHGMRYFTALIESACLQYSDPEGASFIGESYARLIHQNHREILFFEAFLKKWIASFNNATFARRMDDKFRPFGVTYQHTQYQISQIKANLRSLCSSQSGLPPINKANTPLTRTYVILDASGVGSPVEYFLRAALCAYRELGSDTGYLLLDMKAELSGRVHTFLWEDAYKNRFETVIALRADYKQYLYGSLVNFGMREKQISLPSVDSSEEQITVYTPRGDKIRLPVGATGIDVAFALRAEIGLSAFDILINSQDPAFARDITTTLHDGDFFYVRRHPQETVGDRSAKREYPVRARLEWLRHVKTTTARDQLIQYFSQRFQEDSPEFETVADDKTYRACLYDVLKILDQSHLVIPQSGGNRKEAAE